VAIFLLCAGVRSRVTVDYLVVGLPIFEFAHVFYILF
jgi:hypothetical protein